MIIKESLNLRKIENESENESVVLLLYSQA